MYASTAILAAISHRDHTGDGQYIDMPPLDTQIAVMANVSSAYHLTSVRFLSAGVMLPQSLFSIKPSPFLMAG
jgi:crotonobetainyl-CoA:carnitine CoA-transferase CaiB-like acyl-CoA transferase